MIKFSLFVRGDPDQALRWLKQAHKLRNALYDFIEGMDKYKFKED